MLLNLARREGNRQNLVYITAFFQYTQRRMNKYTSNYTCDFNMCIELYITRSISILITLFNKALATRARELVVHVRLQGSLHFVIKQTCNRSSPLKKKKLISFILNVCKTVSTDTFSCYSNCTLSFAKRTATVSGKLLTRFPILNPI